MSEKSIGKEMFDKLSYKRKNVYEEATSDEIKAIFEYSEGYMKYLDDSKTEREAVIASIKLAEKCGYSYSYYFAREFRKSFGCTPKEYRQKNGK